MGHNIGDRVRVKCLGSSDHGKECTVISELQSFYPGDRGETFQGHRVDLPHWQYKWCAFEPHELIPIYDGHEICNWEDCAWRPLKVSAKRVLERAC